MNTNPCNANVSVLQKLIMLGNTFFLANKIPKRLKLFYLTHSVSLRYKERIQNPWSPIPSSPSFVEYKV